MLHNVHIHLIHNYIATYNVHIYIQMYTLAYLVYACTYVTPLIDSEIAANALLNLP